MAASPGRLTAPSGGSGWIARRATIDARKLTTSTAYAPASPTVAMRIPPIAGPTIEASWKFSWLSAIAVGSRSARDEARDRRRACRLVDRAESGRDAAAMTNRAMTGGDAVEREPDQREAAGGQRGLGQRAAAAGGPSTSASEPAPEREDQDGDQLEEAQQPDRQGRAGQDVDLVRQRDPGDLVADAADDLARPQPAEVAVAPERRGIEEDPADPAGGTAGRSGRRRCCQSFVSAPRSAARGSRIRRRSVCPCVANGPSPASVPVTTSKTRSSGSCSSWTRVVDSATDSIMA